MGAYKATNLPTNLFVIYGFETRHQMLITKCQQTNTEDKQQQ